MLIKASRILALGTLILKLKPNRYGYRGIRRRGPNAPVKPATGKELIEKLDELPRLSEDDIRDLEQMSRDQRRGR